jgi:hypothetical protein
MADLVVSDDCFERLEQDRGDLSIDEYASRITGVDVRIFAMNIDLFMIVHDNPEMTSWEITRMYYASVEVSGLMVAATKYMLRHTAGLVHHLDDSWSVQ